MKKININFKPELFNPTFLPYVDTNYDYEIYYGGGGSGKSVFIAQKEIIKCLKEPYYRLIYCRKTAESIRDSQFQLFKDIITDWGLWDFFIAKESTMDIICTNGNMMLAQGLDKIEKVKSISEPTDIWVEEATDCDQRDIEQLGLRIRTKKVKKVQYILSFNPVDEAHWIKSYFFPTESENKKKYTYTKTFKDEQKNKDITLSYLLLHTTYVDNKFLPVEYKARLDQLSETNPNYYKIYKLGLWGRSQTGGEFYKMFSYVNQVRVLEPNPLLPLHISFDFNVQPYCSLTVWQVDGKKAYQIDEITTVHPNNTPDSLCRIFKSKYPLHTYNAGLFYYGDPSGKKEETTREYGHNNYYIIDEELKEYNPHRRVASKAPSIVKRGEFINAIFSKNFEGIEIYINETCKKTITDYEHLKEDHEGNKAKKMKTDKEKGLSYQEFGHLSDANDYLICSIFSTEYTYYLTGNRKLEYSMGFPKKRIW